MGEEGDEGGEIKRFIYNPMDNKENTNSGKEFLNSTGIFFLLILVNFVVQIILGPLLLGPLFFYFNFIPSIIGPLILIIFMIRGVRLFRKTRSIKLVIVSVVMPILIFPSIILLGITIYPSLNDLPLNVFKPQIDFIRHSIVQKEQKLKLEKLAADTKVNPSEICVTREYLGEAGHQRHMYIWAIEWRGAIKFPQGEIPDPYGVIVNDIDAYQIVGAPYIENNGNGIYQRSHPDGGFGSFLSDGNFHKWKIVFDQAHPVLNENQGYKVNFGFLNIKTEAYSEMKMGDYYIVVIPDLLIQKIQSLYKVENAPGYVMEEYYTRPLTEMERQTGEVCVSL